MIILVHTWLVEADTTISGLFVWAEMKIILFIHLNNHMDGARGTLWMSFVKNYSLPHQIKSLGPKKINQLLPIKYELKLSSEVMPGLLPFRSISKQCEHA